MMGDDMKRLLPVGVALVAMTTLGLAVPGIAGATGASTAARNVPTARAHEAAVTIGSQWTFYDYEYGPTFVICEVMTFDASKVFVGDKGDAGKWSSSASSTKLTFNGAGIFVAGTWKGGFIPGDGTYSGTYKVKSGGAVYGPMVLASGVDPYSFGSC
jgi:hypothetical protein